ncbi:MAG TPA: respiratory nitrate reductase subunit gamma [Candidatus Nitrosotenuis sp.]|nr:respiratory nitrate reductase subunit gamma [Candidatus Nitrosotenuis sp.]
MFDNFFFAGLPYVTLLLFVGGSIYRAFYGIMADYRGRIDWSVRGDLLWTTRSTGFFGRASIGPAALCLHWGMLTLILAHVVGFIGGGAGWPGWVEFFRWVGMFGGVVLLYGACWALVRRLLSPQLRAMSTHDDYGILIFLIAIVSLGLYHSVMQQSWGVSYPVGSWLAGIFTLRPDATLVAGAPLVVKLHMVVAMLFGCYFPFTKLVHAFSYPFSYIARPNISMRSYAGLKR